MSLNLRPYQTLAKQQFSKFFEEGGQAGILCMPTGAGKTVTFADMSLDAINSGATAMILCNRRELISQANAKLKLSGLHPVIIDPSYRDRYSNLYLASVDTLRNRKPPKLDFLIIDEAHNRTFDPFAKYYKEQGTYLVGATATPIRYGKKLIEGDEEYTGQLGDIYSKIIEPVTIQELLDQGYLVPSIHFQPVLELPELKKQGEDFSDKSLHEAYNKPKMFADVVGKYLKHTPNTKAICFNVSVEVSQKVTQEFINAGVPAAHVDGTEDKRKREEIFAKFTAGEIMVLCNVGIATTGYDEPSIETVILNFATLSLSKYLQCCGRGSRLFDGKHYFYIIDMGNNWSRHGYWEDDREYSLFRDFATKKMQPGIVIMCESCEALIPSKANHCPNCKASQEKAIEKREAAKAAQLAEAEFVVADKTVKVKPLTKMSISELEEFRKAKEYSLQWMVNQLLPRGKSALQEYATMRNFSASWVPMQLKMAEDKKVKTLDVIWEYIQDNPHLSESDIESFAHRKLRSNHTSQEISILVPKILEAKRTLV